MGDNAIDRLMRIDEAALNEEERLGLAWCRLNYGGWDPLLGPEPMPEDRLTYSLRGMTAIESIIGAAQANWYAWRFLGLGNRKEWLQWWLTKDFPRPNSQRHGSAPIKAVKAVRRLLRRR